MRALYRSLGTAVLAGLIGAVPAIAQDAKPAPEPKLTNATPSFDITITPSQATTSSAAGEELTFYSDRASCEGFSASAVTETFDEASIGAGGIESFETPLNEFSDNVSFDPGDIPPGLYINAFGDEGEADALVASAPGFAGLPNTSPIVGANAFAANSEISVFPGTDVVCADYFAFNGSTLIVEVYDADGNLLGSQTSTAAPFAEGFFGVSTSGTLIQTVRFNDTSVPDDSDTKLLDNVTFNLIGTPPPPPPPDAEVTYMGTTTGGPVWNRPFTVGDGTSGSCSLSGTATAVSFGQTPFFTDLDGTYAISEAQTYDGYLFVYEGAFDENDPCAGLIALNDDGNGGIGTSDITGLNLTADTQYIIISSGFGNADAGDYNGVISGPGDANIQLGTVGTPPPPPGDETVNEEGDAPLLLDGTQDATGGISIINGAIQSDADLADCFTITIADIDSFSATTENTDPRDIDSQLYLFSPDGTAIVFNDDTPDAPQFLSTLPIGSLSGLGLSTGDYVLCITEFDTDPQNAAGEDIYSANGTTVRLPDPPNGDAVLAGWVPSIINPGNYRIDLTGTGIGEPPPPDDPITFDSINLNGLTVPSDGGRIKYKMQIDNNGDDEAQVDIWAMVQDETGTTTIYIRKPRTFSVPGNSRIRSGYGQFIPGYVPDGTYLYTLMAGTYNPDDPANSMVSGFTPYVVTKGGEPLRDWDPTAELKMGLDAHGVDWYHRALERLPSLVPQPEPKAWTDITYSETVVLPLDNNEDWKTGTSTLADGSLRVGPNPVRDRATIAFSIEEAADVTVVLYDLLGREVARVVDERLQPGTHQAALDASALVPGTYVYRMTVGAQSESGRLTVVR